MNEPTETIIVGSLVQLASSGPTVYSVIGLNGLWAWVDSDGISPTTVLVSFLTLAPLDPLAELVRLGWNVVFNTLVVTRREAAIGALEEFLTNLADEACGHCGNHDHTTDDH